MYGFGYVRGVPRNIYYTGYKQPAALSLEEYSADINGNFEINKGIDRPLQDWTGWQIATTTEVVQFIQEEYGVLQHVHPVHVWCRINTGGLYLRAGVPTIRNSERWTDWVRVTNIA